MDAKKAHQTQQANSNPAKKQHDTASKSHWQLPQTIINQNDILQLQRLMGNQAVQRLIDSATPVQRQSTGQKVQYHARNLIQREDPVNFGDDVMSDDMEEEPLLSDQEAQKAIRYYERRPELYTTEIIREIQTRVNVEPTGVVDEAMVQAVAEMQMWLGGRLGSQIDGMAGPRTLPSAFPQGLATEESQSNYARDATAIEAEWEDLGTKEARAEKYVKEVNDELSAAGVPTLTYDFASLTDAAAVMVFYKWKMTLDEAAFSANTIDNEAGANVGNYVYHEGRHAEQWYMITQMLAGEKIANAGNSPDLNRIKTEIMTEMELDPEAAGMVDTAMQNTVEPGSMEAVIAKGFYESIYGAGADARNHALDHGGEAYENLPEETDAYQQGDSVRGLLISSE